MTSFPDPSIGFKHENEDPSSQNIGDQETYSPPPYSEYARVAINESAESFKRPFALELLRNTARADPAQREGYDCESIHITNLVSEAAGGMPPTQYLSVGTLYEASRDDLEGGPLTLPTPGQSGVVPARDEVEKNGVAKGSVLPVNDQYGGARDLQVLNQPGRNVPRSVGRRPLPPLPPSSISEASKSTRCRCVDGNDGKKYRCMIPDCGKTFQRNSGHVLSGHFGYEGDLVCPTCKFLRPFTPSDVNGDRLAPPQIT